MELFRGYVKTKDKRATTSWGSGKLLSLDQVKDDKEYAGVLAKDTILLDIDNHVQARIVAKIIKEKNIKCRIAQTTRGKHFFFKGCAVKKCHTDIDLTCTFQADFKVGYANSYAVLKYDGQERAIEYDTGEYEELPAWLWPIKKPNFSFLDVKQGSRNSSLYEYILQLQGAGLTKEQCRETLRIINNYILDDPLDDDELETIMRDEAFTGTNFFAGSKFLHDKFANWFASEENIKKINGQLHIYQDGVYIANTELIEGVMVSHMSSLKDNQRKEVLKYLNISLKNQNRVIDARYIAFKNGVLDLATDKMLPFSPELLVVNKINFNYNPEAYDKLLDETLTKLACKDKQIRAILEECAGYCLFRKQELGKAFLFLGGPAGGKSTYLSLLQEMLGVENICSLELQELGERFNTYMLHNKLACLGDDISEEFMKGRQVSLFKKITTGNRIKAEMKGLPPFEFEPYAKLIFSANQMPRTKDMTGAVIRRLIIVPFNAQFTHKDKNFDPYIKYRLCEPQSIEYLIALGIAGLRRVLENKKFTSSKLVDKELSSYEIENNPALAFIKMTGSKNIVDQRVRDVYIAYKEFCFENGYQALANIAFSKYVRKELGVESKNITVDGISSYIYKK